MVVQYLLLVFKQDSLNVFSIVRSERQIHTGEHKTTPNSFPHAPGGRGGWRERGAHVGRDGGRFHMDL